MKCLYKTLLYFSLLIVCTTLIYVYQYNTYLKNKIQKHINNNDILLNFNKNLNFEDKIPENKVLNKDLSQNIDLDEDFIDISILPFVLQKSNINDIDETLKEINRITRKKVILFEDTPESEFDIYFTKKHTENFKSKEEWIEIFRKNGMKCIQCKNLSRFSFPFARKPLFYPVSKTFMIFETS